MAKRVFVTGGSGFLGINLIRHLHKAGYEITSYDIAPFDYEDMQGKIKEVLGDIRDKKALREAMEGCGLVVHTAAALPLYKEKDIYSTDLKGTRNVLSTAQELDIKRVVHISSTAVYGIPDHHPLFEDDKKEGVGPYGICKVKAEQICEKYRQMGMTVPILRPKSFVGPERLGVMAIYYDWISRNKNIPIIGWGHNKYQLLDVEDLCVAIKMCLEKPKAIVNDTYNIGAKEYTTMKEDFGAILKHIKSDKRVIGTPAKPLVLLLRFLEFLHVSPLYKWVYETAPEDSFVSVEKAEKKLGFITKYSTKEALIRNYEWYIAHKDEFEGKSGVSHRVPWKQGVLKIASWFF